MLHALPESARSLEVTFGLEQGFESEDGVRIAAPARALHRRGGTDEILAGREEDAEAERSSRMAGCVGRDDFGFGGGWLGFNNTPGRGGQYYDPRQNNRNYYQRSQRWF